MRRLPLVLAVLTATLGPAVALAQTFSPGELSRAHAHLDGMANCKRCHVSAGQPGPAACLACHTELKTRIDAGRGFHGRMSAKDREDCNACHAEHQGRDFALVDWGAGGRDRFDHSRTGFRLDGKHAQQKCVGCHDRKRMVDDGVKKLLDERPRRTTFLGLASPCVACHFDEHRGQEGNACEKCHTAAGWKPAPGFLHQKAAFPLTGKHQRVLCAKCHPAQTDSTTPASAFPAPVNKTFLKYKGVEFAACNDCHADTHHKGKFGPKCESCHMTSDWKDIKNLTNIAFHQTTRFPLHGMHVTVACDKCHRPGGGPKKFKGIPFEKCTSCHADGHAGQLERKGRPTPDCVVCHTVEGYKPAHFELEQHATTRYPLTGAHRLVACSRCHKDNPELARMTPEYVRLAKAGKAVKLAAVDLQWTEPLERCETCHNDPHVGQFAARAAQGGCAYCHQITTFTALKFDHAKDSRFPLTGKHATAACKSCHRTEKLGGATFVRYKPLPTACGDCHRDIHFGQLAKDGSTDCARCHDTRAFKPSRFDHGNATFTDFALVGQHQKVECVKCHPDVRLDGDNVVRRYRGIPRVCETCHVDIHRGAFAGFEPASSTSGLSFPRAAPTSSKVTRCAACHSSESWASVAFPHERTGFPLRGAHQRTSCKSCHHQGFDRPVPNDCSSCHRDIHQGEFGLRCEACHREESWATTFTADAHRRTAFPLTGRHAFMPCTECHKERGERGFGHATVRCVDCHLANYQMTGTISIDHQASGFNTDCRQCHSGWRFTPAAFPQHNVCFPLSGPHGGIACRSCHTSIPSGAVTGACATNTAACSACHAHTCSRMDQQHRVGQANAVPGYQCKDRKCFECHRSAP